MPQIDYSTPYQSKVSAPPFWVQFWALLDAVFVVGLFLVLLVLAVLS